MISNRIAAIILAAGLSDRMGRFKPLLPLGGRTLIEQVISTFRTCGVSRLLVVAGYRRRELAAAITTDGVVLVENPAYRSGMYSSVLSGVRRLPLDTEAFFIMPVDIPLVRPATILRLLDGRARHPGKILYPCFLGKRGHPPLIPAHIAGEIADGFPSESLRNVLVRHADEAVEVAVPDRHILFDVDTAEDYQELSARWAKHDVPSAEECEAILGLLLETADDLVRHCRAVARVAGAIARALVDAGVGLDLELIYAAALLHDIAKSQKDQALVGGELLHRLGFARTGDLVAAHADPDLPAHAAIREAEVLYLADTLLQGERLVSLDQRFSAALERCGGRPEERETIKKRWDRALFVKKRMEYRLGQPLAGILPDTALRANAAT
jgi:molybdenum cofactor cytidylyltransferase